MITAFIKGIKNFFPMPNLIFSLGLNVAEMALYMYLMYIEDREKHTCHPSFKTIGKALKMSKTTVKKYVDSLVEKRMISVEQTSIITESGVKRNGTLLYNILPIQNALDYSTNNRPLLLRIRIKIRPIFIAGISTGVAGTPFAINIRRRCRLCKGLQDLDKVDS